MYRGGQVGGGGVGGGGGWVGKPKAGSLYHQGTNSGAVPSVGDRYVDIPQDGSRLTLAAV